MVSKVISKITVDIILAKNAWDLFSTEESTTILSEVNTDESKSKQLNRERKQYYTTELSKQERLDSLDIEKRGRLRTAFMWNTDVLKYIRDYTSEITNNNMSEREKYLWDEYIAYQTRTNLSPTEGYYGVTKPDTNGYAYLLNEDDTVDYRTCPEDVVFNNNEGLEYQSLDKVLLSIIDDDEDFVKISNELARKTINKIENVTFSVDTSETTGQETSGSLGYGRQSTEKDYNTKTEYNNIIASDTFYVPYCPVGTQAIIGNCYNYEDSNGSWEVTATSSSSGANPEYYFSDIGKWIADDIQEEHWIQAETIKPTLISRYRITIDIATETMNDWMLTAWSEKANAWILLDRKTDYVWKEDGQTQDFLLKTRAWYSKVRLRMIGSSTGVYKNDAGATLVLINGIIIPKKTENILANFECDIKGLLSTTGNQAEMIWQAFEAPLKPTGLTAIKI